VAPGCVVLFLAPVDAHLVGGVVSHGFLAPHPAWVFVLSGVVVCVRSVIVVCLFVKDIVINAGSEPFPGFFTAPAGGSGITTTGDTDTVPDPAITDLHPIATRFTTPLLHAKQHRYGQAGTGTDTSNPYTEVLYTEKTVDITRREDERLCPFLQGSLETRSHTDGPEPEFLDHPMLPKETTPHELQRPNTPQDTP